MKQKWIIYFNFIILFFYISCQTSSIKNGDNELKELTILYTSDEHGWLEPGDNFGGAPGMVALWKNNENYTKDGDLLILSGGDMWTGPAISTWFQGESMAEIMNAMGYDAAAIGNHEFDFQDSLLLVRAKNSKFPFLAANIIETSTGNIPKFATPYIIKEVNGLKIGIIGLASISTSFTTFPDYVKDYSFLPYENAIKEIVPQVKDDGAEILIVLGHICPNEMRTISKTASKLGISFILGGHCHEQYNTLSNGVRLVEPGANLNLYAKIIIHYNESENKVIESIVSFHENNEDEYDSEIQEIVNSWKGKADESLSEIIGYVETEIEDETIEIYNLVTDSWFYTFPDVDITFTNTGGIRQSIPHGDITIETIVGVLPFNNSILQLELSGSQVITCSKDLVFGGMTSVGGYYLSDGREVHPDSIYDVLTTDYLYSRSDILFNQYDTTPYNTSVHYRQPLIDWLKSINTSVSNPLDNYLDFTKR